MSDKRTQELEALASDEGFPLPMPASLIARLERAGYVVDLITGEVCSNVTVTTTPLAKTICHLLTPSTPKG